MPPPITENAGTPGRGVETGVPFSRTALAGNGVAGEKESEAACLTEPAAAPTPCRLGFVERGPARRTGMEMEMRAFEAANLLRPLALWVSHGVAAGTGPEARYHAAASAALLDAAQSRNFDPLRARPEHVRAAMAAILFSFIDAAQRVPNAIIGRHPQDASEADRRAFVLRVVLSGNRAVH